MRMWGARTDQGGREGAPAGPGPSLGTPRVPGYLHGPGAKLTKLLPLQEPTRWMGTVTSLVRNKACPRGKLLYLSEGSPTSRPKLPSCHPWGPGSRAGACVLTAQGTGSRGTEPLQGWAPGKGPGVRAISHLPHRGG